MEGPPESVTEAIERARIKAIYREMRLAASHATEQIRIELYATHCLRWILEAFRSHLEASGAGGIAGALRSIPSGIASGIRAGKPDPIRDDTRERLWRYSMFFGVNDGEIIPKQFQPKTTHAQEAPRVFEYPLDLMNVLFSTALSKMVRDIADVTRDALRVASTYENTQNNMGVSFALDSQSANGIAKRILGALDAAHERWSRAAGEMHTALNNLQLARTRMPTGGTYARLGGVPGHGHGGATMSARGGGGDGGYGESTPEGPPRGLDPRLSAGQHMSEENHKMEEIVHKVERAQIALGEAQKRKYDALYIHSLEEQLAKCKIAYKQAFKSYQSWKKMAEQNEEIAKENMKMLFDYEYEHEEKEAKDSHVEMRGMLQKARDLLVAIIRAEPMSLKTENGVKTAKFGSFVEVYSMENHSVVGITIGIGKKESYVELETNDVGEITPTWDGMTPTSRNRTLFDYTPFRGIFNLALMEMAMPIPVKNNGDLFQIGCKNEGVNIKITPEGLDSRFTVIWKDENNRTMMYTFLERDYNTKHDEWVYANVPGGVAFIR